MPTDQFDQVRPHLESSAWATPVCFKLTETDHTNDGTRCCLRTNETNPQGAGVLFPHDGSLHSQESDPLFWSLPVSVGTAYMWYMQAKHTWTYMQAKQPYA